MEEARSESTVQGDSSARLFCSNGEIVRIVSIFPLAII